MGLPAKLARLLAEFRFGTIDQVIAPLLRQL
jgi:hypothetical protein